MAKILTPDLETVDFDSAVEEVDVLVPKYLDALDTLGQAVTIEEVGPRLQGVVAYWGRLSLLFQQISKLEIELPLDEIIISTLQSELTVLEHVYLRINLRLQISEAEWTDDLFTVATSVLDRMDQVLQALSFEESHKDRIFVQKVRSENEHKLRLWLMRRHTSA